MRRIAPLKARDAEDEQLAEKSWSTKMKVLSRRSMAPSVLFLLCVVSLLFRMRQEKLKFISVDLGYSMEVGHESSLTSSVYQNATQATLDRLRSSTPSLGWRPSAALRNLQWPRSTTRKKQRIPRGAMQWWPQPAAGCNL